MFQKNNLKFKFNESLDIFMNYLILSGPGLDTKSYDLTRIVLTFFHKYKK